MVAVGLLQTLAGREPGSVDAAFTGVEFTGGDPPLETGGEELLVGPGLDPGPFTETLDGGSE